MSLAVFTEKARKFEKSSGYRSGDRTSFAIRLHDTVTLGGSCSASAYLDTLGLEKLPDRVMVICPGNGGLVAECYARGAKQVVALEPRTRFQATLLRTLELLSDAWRLDETENGVSPMTRSHQAVMAWPRAGREQGFQDFDLILWPEGVEEITEPKVIFQTVADCLNPGGTLIVELNNGRHQWVDKINSWRPTGHAVNDMAAEIFKGKPTDTKGGRNANSRIYTLTLPGKKKVAAKIKKKKKKAASKPKPAPKPAPKVEKPVEAVKEERKAFAERVKPFVSEDYIEKVVLNPEAEADKPAAKPAATPSPKPKATKKTSKKKKKKAKKAQPKADDAGE